MVYGESGLSASDVALLSGNNSRNNDGFGDGNGWWIIIFLIFAFMGWGNGFGGYGNNGGAMGAADNYVLASDFATLQRQIDNGFNTVQRDTANINNGLCNGFYQQAQLVNGVNSNIANSTATIQQTLCQGFNGVNSSIASCCCDIREGISGINYNMAMNNNALQNTLCNTTRDIIDNQNANYRALHDEIVANRIEDKNAQIVAQQNEINALRLAASQEKQNNFLINELKPCPIPAFLTCNPYTGSFGYTNVGYNNGCGCNNCCGCN